MRWLIVLLLSCAAAVANSTTFYDGLFAAARQITAGGGTLWTPSEITTAAWYDASDASTIISSTNFVSQWNDKSGNGRNLVQANGARQPQTGARTIGTLNALNFNAFNLARTGSFTTNTVSIFIMTQLDTVGNQNKYVYTDASGSTGPYLMQVQANATVLLVDTVNETNTTLAANGIYIFEAIQNGASSEIRINGGAATVGTLSTGLNEGLCIGARWANAIQFYSYDGAIGEVVIAAGTVDTDTRQKMEGYLAWKWGEEANLPPGHPYENAAPTVE